LAAAERERAGLRVEKFGVALEREMRHTAADQTDDSAASNAHGIRTPTPDPGQLNVPMHGLLDCGVRRVPFAGAWRASSNDTVVARHKRRLVRFQLCSAAPITGKLRISEAVPPAEHR
jgi:hypothetical protein